MKKILPFVRVAFCIYVTIQTVGLVLGVAALTPFMCSKGSFAITPITLAAVGFMMTCIPTLVYSLVLAGLLLLWHTKTLRRKMVAYSASTALTLSVFTIVCMIAFPSLHDILDPFALGLFALSFPPGILGTWVALRRLRREDQLASGDGRPKADHAFTVDLTKEGTTI